MAGLLLALAGCSSAPKVAPRPSSVVIAPRPVVEKADRAFLIDPVLGYSLSLDDTRRGQLASAHRAAVEEGGLDQARRLAIGLLEVDPALAPASVLLAQVEFLQGEQEQAARRLRPVVESFPTYTAALLTLGRAEEELERVVEAYAAYRGALASVGAAGSAVEGTVDIRAIAARAEQFHSRAVEIVGQRLVDGLERGRVDIAEAELGRLEAWAPRSEIALEGRLAVSRELKDSTGELTALRELLQLQPDDQTLIRRRAELELEVGDPSSGLQIFQRLAQQYPEDPEVIEGLDRARFRWRLQMLPENVRKIAGVQPQLTRAQFATLVYWLIPDVRYGRPQSARIANDILELSNREQIARVVNLGLMSVDSTRHQFFPELAVNRGDALLALLMALGIGDQPASCLAQRTFDRRSSTESICAGAARCLLLRAAGECLPRSSVTGPEAVELVRRALDQR